ADRASGTRDGRPGRVRRGDRDEPRQDPRRHANSPLAGADPAPQRPGGPGGGAMTDVSPTQHARAAELAALSVDFTLSAAERAELDRHLAVCGTCNDLLAAYRADAEALRSEAFAHAPERVR